MSQTPPPPPPPDERPRDVPRDVPPARRAPWREQLAFWRPRVGDVVDDELRFHLEMRVRDYLAAGMTEQQARDAAAARFGDIDAARAACVAIGRRRERRASRADTLASLAQDVRFALRTLGRQKAWTAVAVLTLALGIGANTAVFSVVDGVLLRPLPYPDADRVVLLWQASEANGISVSPSEKLLDAWRRNARSLEALESFRPIDVTLSGRGDAELVHAAAIAPSFLRFAGARLVAGRAFAPEESSAGGPAVVVLGEGFWRARFDASRDAVGRTLVLDGRPYTVIGVASASLRVPAISQERTDLWLPLLPDTAVHPVANVARLRPGVTQAAAQRELDAIAGRAGLAMHAGTVAFTTKVTRPSQMVGFRESLLMLAGAVALLLLVACANVAHLLLARGAARERELAIRAALGAGHGRLVRQLLTESLVLASLGCAAGLAIGVGGLRLLLGLRPASLGQLATAEVNGTVLWTAVALSTVTGLAFGLVAALHAARAGTAESLKASAATGTGGRTRHRLRSALVVTEMALSTMLLVGALLLVRSVVHLQQVDPGMDTRDLYGASIALRPPRYTSEAQVAAFSRELLERARRLPGVRQATLAASVPPQTSFVIGAIEVDGRGPAADAQTFTAANYVRPEYFATLGVPLRAGRAFTDASEKENEVVINEGMARSLWPGVSAVGRRFRLGSGGFGGKPSSAPWLTVIGVVGNTVTRGLGSDRADPMIYFPTEAGAGMTERALILRAAPGVDPMPAVRRLVTSLDPYLPVAVAGSVRRQVDETIAVQRFTMTLLAVFAGLAVALSAVGLYGVISYVVAQRTREIGIRIALGATRAAIARSVVGRGLALSASGAAIGLVGATWATRVIRGLLYGVEPTDATSYLLGALVLVAISAAACLLPTHRAMAVDPMIAMRAE